jgi:hypothetical protein
MPTVKRIADVTFEPRNFQAPGLEHLKTFSFEINIEGFPSNYAGTSERVKGASGTWLLSRTSFESQDSVPLELTPESDTADLQGQSWGEEFPGQLWLYKGWAYFSDDREGLEAEDVRALLNVEANKRRLTLEKAHALQAMSDSYDKPRRRETISQAVRVEVWQRDRGRCVECDSQERLEFDHIIPVAMGGGNTSRNLQLLCETCNRRKGASLG